MNGENKDVMDLDWEGFDGTYLGVEGQENYIKFDYRKMLDYAHSKGLRLRDLSEDEVMQFRIDK